MLTDYGSLERVVDFFKVKILPRDLLVVLVHCRHDGSRINRYLLRYQRELEKLFRKLSRQSKFNDALYIAPNLLISSALECVKGLSSMLNMHSLLVASGTLRGTQSEASIRSRIFRAAAVAPL